MFGIPFVILREGETGGMPETVYLRTYRRGKVGQEMKTKLKAYHAAQLSQTRAATQMPVLVAQAQQCVEQESADGLQAIAARQNEAIAEAQVSADMALDAAELIAELALLDNYGAEKTEGILDKLTDRELHAIVGTIEMGEMPRDFFRFIEARQKLISTGRSGDSQEISSSEQASPGTTLKAEK